MNATIKLNTATTVVQTVQNTFAIVYARMTALAGEISHAVQAESNVQRAIDDLATMNEHQLRDIGLMRSDIEQAVRGSLHTGGPRDF